MFILLVNIWLNCVTCLHLLIMLLLVVMRWVFQLIPFKTKRIWCGYIFGWSKLAKAKASQLAVCAKFFYIGLIRMFLCFCSLRSNLEISWTPLIGIDYFHLICNLHFILPIYHHTALFLSIFYDDYYFFVCS